MHFRVSQSDQDNELAIMHLNFKLLEITLIAWLVHWLVNLHSTQTSERKDTNKLHNSIVKELTKAVANLFFF
jgi:hypothetical protein